MMTDLSLTQTNHQCTQPSNKTFPFLSEHGLNANGVENRAMTDK